MTGSRNVEGERSRRGRLQLQEFCLLSEFLAQGKHPLGGILSVWKKELQNGDVAVQNRQQRWHWQLLYLFIFFANWPFNMFSLKHQEHLRSWMRLRLLIQCSVVKPVPGSICGTSYMRPCKCVSLVLRWRKYKSVISLSTVSNMSPADSDRLPSNWSIHVVVVVFSYYLPFNKQQKMNKCWWSVIRDGFGAHAELKTFSKLWANRKQHGIFSSGADKQTRHNSVPAAFYCTEQLLFIKMGLKLYVYLFACCFCFVCLLESVHCGFGLFRLCTVETAGFYRECGIYQAATLGLGGKVTNFSNNFFHLFKWLFSPSVPWAQTCWISHKGHIYVPSSRDGKTRRDPMVNPQRDREEMRMK